MSDRSLFLAAMLLGFATAVPGWAWAKGQWCNDEHVLFRATMTLETVTVAGQSVAPPAGGSFDLTTSADDWITARVFCSACEAQVVSREHLVREP
jgi:hypothetical protein